MEPQKTVEKQTGTQPGKVPGIGFLKYTLHRFAEDQAPQRAAALTYTTLLAMVPLLAISFAVFSAFPAYEGMREQLQTFVFENFVPQVGPVVLEHLQDFVGKTGRLTAVGIVFLVVTSVMLLSSISSAFNAIWRVRQSRSLLLRLPAYWLILTAPPILMGAAMSLSGYLFTVAQASGVEAYTGPLVRLALLLPPIMQIGGLFLLYIFAPNYPVRWRDAMIGGITAGLVLEILKKGFGLYVIYFPTYQTIYGALATFPIFLLWMYVVWMVVLYGAEMAAALPEWRAGLSHRAAKERSPAAVLSAAAAILALLQAASRRGGGLRRRPLMRRSGQPPELLDLAAGALRRSRYIARTETGEWVLARDLDVVTLSDLHRDLGLSVAPTAAQAAQHPWGVRLSEALLDAEEASHGPMDRPLKPMLEMSEESREKLTRPDEEDGGDDEEAGPGEQPGDYKSKLLAWLGLAWLGTR